MKYWPTKTAGAVRDLGLDWTPTLEQLSGGPTISGSVWEKLHGDADCSSGVFSGNTTTVRVFGGTANQETVFRNTITLSNGVVIDEDVFIKCRA